MSLPPKALRSSIAHYATFPQSPVSLSQLAAFGRRVDPGVVLRSSMFLAEELPIRLARRVQELDMLPEHLADAPSIKRVKQWYSTSFAELVSHPRPTLSRELRALLSRSAASSTPLPRATPNPNPASSFRSPPSSSPSPTSPQSTKPRQRIPLERYFATATSEPGTVFPPEIYAYNASFRSLLEGIKRRHDPTVPAFAQGILEWKRVSGPLVPANPRRTQARDRMIQAALERFLMARIGIRLLMSQHIEIARYEEQQRNGELSPPPEGEFWVGAICTNTNVRQVALVAIENARWVCERHYTGLLEAPEVQLFCDEALTFPYMPGHLNHVVFELVKNSLRAVVEAHSSRNPSSLSGWTHSEKFPPVRVIVAKGEEDITIKISDEGGGFPRSLGEKVFDYSYTTMPGGRLEEGFQGGEETAPLAGLGFGLGMSRLYARYFGGNLELLPMEGHGTDAFLHLNRLSSSSEPLY